MTKQTMGYVMASYYGGRSEVRVRRIAVPVISVDFTSMYPTIFSRQKLQTLIGSLRINQRIVTDDTRRFLETITLDRLYDPAIWPSLNRIALIQPDGDIVPVRMRLRRPEKGKGKKREPLDPFTITVTRFTSTCPRWYTLADLVAAKILGVKTPQIIKAIEFVGAGSNPDLQSIDFLGTVLDPNRDIMATVIQERHRAEGSSGDDPKASRRREKALKILGASGGYGIYAEINVAAKTPPASGPSDSRLIKPPEGVWYSDVGPETGDVHDERPGRFFSPVIASLVTGGARLMLAMAETEVANRGGTFAFCDTDSLAIVAGNKAPNGIPCLREPDVAEIIARFDQLNPYDPNVIPHLLKREHTETKELQCYAVSAKRYVLFTRDRRNRLRIVKPSESGIGATIGRSESETVPKLARRIWTSILIEALSIRYRGLRKRRMERLLNFDVPMRRKLPIAQPSVWRSRGFRSFNQGKIYDKQIKPFSFLQTITAVIETGPRVRPIAPFERDVRQSCKLVWTDLESKRPIDLDWNEQGHPGSIPVMRLDEFIGNYARHPEAKAAGPDGMPAGPETQGVLGRLHLTDGQPRRIGKEVDRLDEGENFTLGDMDPPEYTARDHTLEWALGILADEPASKLAPLIGMSERRFRHIRRGLVKRTRRENREAIVRLARSRFHSSTRNRRPRAPEAAP